LLVQAFVGQFCERHKLELKSVSPQVMKALMAYDWPGNVRQLENVVERMVALSGSRTGITATDLPDQIQNKAQLAAAPLIEIPEEGINFQNVVTDMERELIVQSLRRTNGNKKLAAKLLSLKRTTLIEKIKRIGLNENVASTA
jgi:two-component system, NtrC family, response regulator AtoC